MGDLLGSFSGCARVRPKCAGKTCVGLWGQSTVSMSSHQQSEGPGCYSISLFARVIDFGFCSNIIII